MLTDEWKCNHINYLSTGFQQTALNCTARCHQGLAFHTYKLEVNLNKLVRCVNWAVLQSPVQTQLPKTAAFLWLEISWGASQAGWGVTHSWSLIELLPPACSRGKWNRSELMTFTAAQGNLPRSQREGLEAVLPNLSVQQQGQEREGWEKQLFQGLSKSKKYREIRKWLSPVSAESWTIAPMEASAWGDTRHENGAEMVSLGMASWVAHVTWE